MGKDTETETTQESEPWKELQPHLSNMFGGAEEQYNTPSTFFGGQTYAGMNPFQEQGMQAQLDYAGGGMGDQIGGAQAAFQSALQAPDVANNPYLSGQADVITDRLNRNFSEQLMPGIQGGAIGAGQAGSSRQGVAQGIAARGTQEAIGSSLADLYGGAYGTGLQAQSSAMGMAPQMTSLGMLPGQTQQQIGGQYRGEEQLGIDEAMQRHQFEQDEPWDRLNKYSQAVSGGQGYGTSTSTSTQEGNLFQDLLGAGMTGAGMMMGSPSMAMGGASTWMSPNNIPYIQR